MANITKLDQKEKLIELRAREVSYQRCAEEIGVSENTLMKWGRELEIEINNRRQLELDALQEKYFVTKKKRIEFYGEQLNRFFAELKKRDLSDIPTEKLFDLTMKTVASLKQEETEISFKEKKNVEDVLNDHLENSFVEWRG